LNGVRPGTHKVVIDETLGKNSVVVHYTLHVA